MTRDEAIQNVFVAMSQHDVNHPTAFVDSLTALGLLKLDSTEESIKELAAQKIAGSQIVVRYGSSNVTTYLARATATELIDILTKSGFKITR